MESQEVMCGAHAQYETGCQGLVEGSAETLERLRLSVVS